MWPILCVFERDPGAGGRVGPGRRRYPESHDGIFRRFRAGHYELEKRPTEGALRKLLKLPCFEGRHERAPEAWDL